MSDLCNPPEVALISTLINARLYHTPLSDVLFSCVCELKGPLSNFDVDPSSAQGTAITSLSDISCECELKDPLSNFDVDPSSAQCTYNKDSNYLCFLLSTHSHTQHSLSHWLHLYSLYTPLK